MEENALYFPGIQIPANEARSTRTDVAEPFVDVPWKQQQQRGTIAAINNGSPELLLHQQIANEYTSINSADVAQMGEDESCGWLQSEVDDPFLRELWSNLYLPSYTTQLCRSSAADPTFTPELLGAASDHQQPNDGAGSSSSAGSGSGGGEIGRTRIDGAGYKRKKGREDSELIPRDQDNEHQLRETPPQSLRLSNGRRNRSAEVHNMSERRRRDRINEKMKALQQMIPNSNKTDKASMLDEAIEYLKSLQLQLQTMWVAKDMATVTHPNAPRRQTAFKDGESKENLPLDQGFHLSCFNPKEIKRLEEINSWGEYGSVE